MLVSSSHRYDMLWQCLRHYFNWSDADLPKINDLSVFYYFVSTSLLHLLLVVKEETRRPVSVWRMQRTNAFCKSS